MENSFNLFDSNIAFYTWVSIVMLALLAIDVVGSVIGGSVSNILNSFDIDMDFDVPGLSALSIPKVPFALLLYFSLFGFSLMPIAFNVFWFDLTGSYLNGLFSFIIATLGIIIGVKNPIISWVARLEESSESYDLKKEIIGQKVVINLGKTTKGSPTEAKYNSKNNGTFYIMVEPIDEKEFIKGDDVTVVSFNSEKSTYFIV